MHNSVRAAGTASKQAYKFAQSGQISTVSMFDLDYYVGDIGSAADAVIARSRGRRGGYACLCNVHLLVSSRRDSNLYRALQSAWCRFPDGAPLAWLARRLGSPAKRVAGTELLYEVVDRGRTCGLRHFFFGGDEATLERVAARLRSEYHGVEIAGALAPPTGTYRELQGEFVERIAAADADVIWCGLGAPKQELWMADVTARLPGSVLLGVGAAFDFVAERKRRAPRLIRQLGLEWAHRLLREPRRLWKRYLVTNTGFALLVLAATCAAVPKRSIRLVQRRFGVAD